MLEIKEIWKDIEGYEGLYQISNKGKVYSLRLEKFLKFSKNKKGYLQVQFTVNCKFKTFKIHRLVALAFIPNPFNLPEVNHKDGDKLNNNDWNLEWNTSQQNILHAIRTGLRVAAKGEKQHSAKLIEKEVLEIRELYKTGKYSQKEIGNKYNVHKGTIQAIIANVHWKHIK